MVDKIKLSTVLLLTFLNQMVLSESTNISINHTQFVGSHNSYKQSMPDGFIKQLMKVNPGLMESLEYEHIPLAEQLDLGIRKLELDVFYVSKEEQFLVGHVQQIDMNSNCATLRICLTQIISWSQNNPTHGPIWISFNAKDSYIFGLPTPEVFSPVAFALMDSIIEEMLGEKLIRPRDIVDLNWPLLDEARGKFILILDEGGAKRDLYYDGWQQRPMFTNAPEGHPAAAIMILNDPIAVSYTHLRAHETKANLVCRLLLEKKKKKKKLSTTAKYTQHSKEQKTKHNHHRL